MKNPKVFIIFLFFLSLILFIIDLPKPLSFSISTPYIPLLNRKIELKNFSLNLHDIDLDLGMVRLVRQFEYRMGLDLQGGVRLVYQVDMKDIPSSQRQNALESVRNVIERRVNFFGVDEPTIQTLKVGDEYRVAVELPGVTDVNSAIGLIGTTAQLSFWEKGASESARQTTASPSAYPLGVMETLGEYARETNLSGKDLKSAKVVFDPNTGAPQVQLNFSTEGSKKFAEITKRNLGEIVAIILDNQVIQAPRVNEPILNGDAVISGGFTVQTAKQLAISLNAGALPAPLTVISQNNIGATLGIDSLKKSLLGGVVGFISIVIFMVALYRKEGSLAVFALLIYTVIVLFIFKFIPVTVTLAGIAGFILSIGMAVDANILIFERMKEERRAGKGRDIAVEIGFRRAWTSIRDSNISSLITCFILYYFGTGIVRGFALTLAIGILVSMFSAITVTRSLLRVFDKN